MGPTTLDEKLLQADRFREARERLESTLKDIDVFYASPQAPIHTGPPDCERCSARKRKITEAFYEYYLSDTPGRWDSNLLDYRQEMARKFNQPGGPNLDEIHAYFQTTFRDYLKQTIFNPKPSQSPDIQTYKNMAADLLDQGKSTNEVLETYHNSQLHTCEPSTAAVIRDLSDSLEPRERAQIYISAYCTSLETDSAPVKNIKQKYARMFEKLVPHDEVISAWREEAAASQEKSLSELKDQLAALHMAQGAHLKVKARKEEKNRKVREQTPQMVMCRKSRCPLEVNLNGTEEITVCEICQWMEKNGRGYGETAYCSDEHCEEDFVSLDVQSKSISVLMIERRNMNVTITSVAVELAAFIFLKLVPMRWMDRRCVVFALIARTTAS